MFTGFFMKKAKIPPKSKLSYPGHSVFYGYNCITYSVLSPIPEVTAIDVA